MVNIREVKQLPDADATGNAFRNDYVLAQDPGVNSVLTKLPLSVPINAAVADAKAYTDGIAGGLQVQISGGLTGVSWNDSAATFTFNKNDGTVITLPIAQFAAIRNLLVATGTGFQISRVTSAGVDRADLKIVFNNGNSIQQSIDFANGMLPAGTLGLSYNPATTTISLTNRAGQTASVNLGIASGLLQDIAFDATSHALTFTFTDGSTKQVVFPMASATADGLMPKESFEAITTLQSEVESLKAGGVWRGTFATYAAFQAAYPSPDASWFVNDFVYIEADETHPNSAGTGQQTAYIVTTNSSGAKVWAFARVVTETIPQATASNLGVVMGDNSTSGKVFVENDGTMSVNGWDQTQADILEKSTTRVFADAITAQSWSVANPQGIALVEQSEPGNFVTFPDIQFMNGNTLLNTQADLTAFIGDTRMATFSSAFGAATATVSFGASWKVNDYIFRNNSGADIALNVQSSVSGSNKTIILKNGDSIGFSWDGTEVLRVATPPTTLPPSGAAGGMLTGTYPNPGISNRYKQWDMEQQYPPGVYTPSDNPWGIPLAVIDVSNLAVANYEAVQFEFELSRIFYGTQAAYNIRGILYLTKPTVGSSTIQLIGGYYEGLSLNIDEIGYAYSAGNIIIYMKRTLGNSIRDLVFRIKKYVYPYLNQTLYPITPSDGNLIYAAPTGYGALTRKYTMQYPPDANYVYLAAGTPQNQTWDARFSRYGLAGMGAVPNKTRAEVLSTSSFTGHDFNDTDYQVPGTYRVHCESAAPNAPITGSMYGIMVTEAYTYPSNGNAKAIMQILYQDNGNIFFRCAFNSTTMPAWRLLTTNSLLLTGFTYPTIQVQNSAGVATTISSYYYRHNDNGHFTAEFSLATGVITTAISQINVSVPAQYKLQGVTIIDSSGYAWALARQTDQLVNLKPCSTPGTATTITLSNRVNITCLLSNA